MRVARYLRVSRLDQNPALQADETAAVIASRRWNLVDTYLDHGVSGSKDRRPELDRLLRDARKGRFDVVLVWRTDRLARSLRHLVSVIDDLAAIGIGFASVNEPFDTTTPSGKLLLSVVGAMAEFERAILIERTRAGLDAARRRGARIGRPRVDVDVERALRLQQQGKSYREIGNVLGVGGSTVHRALQVQLRSTRTGLVDEPAASHESAEISGLAHAV